MNATRNEPVSPWRHIRAIALLPFMNTVVIPAALLLLFSPPDVRVSPVAAVAATVVGVVAAGAGAALVVHCVGLFMRFGSGTIAPWDPTQDLVSRGAYRHSRNPMKTGLFLVLAGEALVTQSGALAIWFVCFVVANILYIRLHEEPRLARRFGALYGDYCARVPRWWPAPDLLRRAEVR